MKIVGINKGHNASTTLLDNGEIVFHLENERLSNIKYDKYPFLSINEIKNFTDHVDKVGLSAISKKEENNLLFQQVGHLTKPINNHGWQAYDLSLKHHFTHAAHGFYNSGFDKALCIIRDGMGSDYKIDDDRFTTDTYGRERSATFIASYPDKFEEIDKELFVSFDTNGIIEKEHIKISNHFSEGLAFEATCVAMGLNDQEGGKIMGMSAYGKPNDEIPPIYVNGRINTDLFKFTGDLHTKVLDYKFKDFQHQADFAYALQKETTEHVKNYIYKMVEKTGIKKVILSGGFFLNCVANYEYLRDDLEIYIEPVAGDGGTSIGVAKYLHHSYTKDMTKRPLKSLYLGPKRTYNLSKGKKVSYDDVAKLIKDRKIVAIFQGGSEAGPRALGNRSILYDPTDPNGKDYVNRVKGREWYRPFAGTILQDYQDEYFNMKNLKESPFMMYAVNVKSDKLPAITHVDKTCRIQTLTKEQNSHYYNLIEAFRKLTGVPVLFNTSLNLSGDCINETIEDALISLEKSKIDYLYLPEQQLLINRI